MPTPGQQLASVPVSGGSVAVHERALVVALGGEPTVVELGLPPLGRPSIVTPAADLGTMQLPVAAPAAVADAVRVALRDRLGLRATATTDPVVAVDVARPAGTGVAMAAGLTHRTLYDAVVRDDAGTWHVVAPHAFYARTDWHDFGIAHVTDLHVARRIDGFHDLLVGLGREDAAAQMFNWNDRCRGFVRYANHLHATGVLDVIVATGDLYDYLFERDDDRDGGGNAQFLHDLLCGRAPGPQFPDVEELRVPIFTVPGNHDYRTNPYDLVFDLDLGIAGEQQITNHSGYHLRWEDAVGDHEPAQRGRGARAQRRHRGADARRRQGEPPVRALARPARVLRRRARQPPHRHARQLVGRRRGELDR